MGYEVVDLSFASRVGYTTGAPDAMVYIYQDPYGAPASWGNAPIQFWGFREANGGATGR